ncbi:MAG: DUF814 domain-containing protein [Chitinivibrionales bacterium]|nr:DUF814 domain-containing protein [Chitinivibrionales bacterium]
MMSTPMSTEQVSDPKEQLRGLLSTGRRLHKRLVTKLEKQRNELAAARDFKHLRQLGDTLLANADALARGADSCELPNAHTGRQVTIKLNPKLDARRNAELYYRKARRAQRGLETIAANAARTEQQLQDTAELLIELGDGIDRVGHDDYDPARFVEEARERLQALGALPRTGRSTTKAAEAVPYRHVRFDGHDIYIGRNDTQNDELTVRFARPWDLWLHVAVHAGSHVVVRRDRKAVPVPDRVVAAAASMAAWFSKARHSSSVEVHVAERRYVEKRRRSPAGEVCLHQYKSVRVNPLSPQELLKRYPNTGDTSDA